jgi:hypothetical protein
VYGEVASVDHEDEEAYLDEFSIIIFDEELKLKP